MIIVFNDAKLLTTQQNALQKSIEFFYTLIGKTNGRE
jgi:hypothetical protein